MAKRLDGSRRNLARSLGPGHIVLDGNPAPLLQRGTAPNFWPMSVVAKRLDGSRCHLVGGRPRPTRHCVRWRLSSPPQKWGIAASNFRPMSVVAKRLDGSRCHAVRPRCGTQPPPLKVAHHPSFRPMPIVAKRSPISATAEYYQPL